MLCGVCLLLCHRLLTQLDLTTRSNRLYFLDNFLTNCQIPSVARRTEQNEPCTKRMGNSTEFINFDQNLFEHKLENTVLQPFDLYESLFVHFFVKYKQHFFSVQSDA